MRRAHRRDVIPIAAIFFFLFAGVAHSSDGEEQDWTVTSNATEGGVDLTWREETETERYPGGSPPHPGLVSNRASGGELGFRSGYSYRLGCNPDLPAMNPSYRMVLLDGVLSCPALTPPDVEPTDDPPEAIPASAPDAPEPIVISRSEAAELLVEVGSAEFNDSSVGYQLVNMPVIVWSTAREHVAETELLGHEVFVRFVPVEFSWDPQDGSAPIVTNDPGAPWPDHTVSHEYAHTSSEQSMTLTTSWSAEFMVAGEQGWAPVDGLIEIETETDPFEIRERLVRLVPEDG
ncbi:MAG: hypothetical protein ACTHW7_14015 [Actinomycetaceae bacterium]